MFIDGDITKIETGIITHQVNCKGVMGSGVAKSIRDKYPQIFKEYKKLCDAKGSDLLGSVDFVEINDSLVVANVFGQDNFGYGEKFTDEDALKQGLETVAEYSRVTGLDVYVPQGIGCVRAGGNWNKIQKKIKKLGFTIIRFKP